MRLVLFLSLVATLAIMNLWSCAVSAQSLPEEEQLLKIGTGALRDGFLDIAEKHFTSFLSLRPRHPRVYDVCYLLGKTLLANGKPKEAREPFRRILRENSSFDEADSVLFWLAQAEIRSANYSEARKVLQTLLRRFPRFEWADYSSYLLGLLDLESRRFQSSELYLKNVSSSTKRADLHLAASFWLGIVSCERNNFEQAIIYFREVIKNSKQAPSGLLRSALLWLGEAQLRAGKFEEAIATYQAYQNQFRQDAHFSDVYWRIGYCYYRAGKRDEALHVFQSFASAPGESRLRWYASYFLGEMYLQAGDYESAIKRFGEVLNFLQAQPLWGASLLGQYWCLLQTGAPEEAQKISQRLLKQPLFPEEKAFIQWLGAEVAFWEGKILDALPYYFNIMNSVFRERALFQIGKGYFFEKRFREAITNLDILFLEFPDSLYLEEAIFIQAECYVGLGMFEQAIGLLDKLLRNRATFPWSLLALTEMGMLLVRDNKLDRAEQVFGQILSSFSQHPLSYYAAIQLGNIHFKRRNVVEAIQAYSVVARGNIVDLLGEAYFRAGELLYLQGRLDNAFDSFEAVIRSVRSNSTWFFLAQLEIANLLSHWNKIDEAKRSYETVLDHSKDEDVKRAARELLSLLPRR